MEWWLVFAVFLYLISSSLIIAEVFIPSGGLLSILALGCVIGGVAIFFHHSMAAGWIGIGVGVVLIPASVIISYKIFPKTRFGKTVTLTPPKRKPGDAIPDTARLKELMEAEGEVLTPLRPVGMCDFSGRRVECVAEKGYVEKGTKIKVIKIEGTQVTVRTIEEEEN